MQPATCVPLIACFFVCHTAVTARVSFCILLPDRACLQGPKDGKESSGDLKIVQLDKELTLEERQLIVKHALATEDQDAEGLLNNIRARMER